MRVSIESKGVYVNKLMKEFTTFWILRCMYKFPSLVSVYFLMIFCIIYTWTSAILTWLMLICVSLALVHSADKSSAWGCDRARILYIHQTFVRPCHDFIEID